MHNNEAIFANEAFYVAFSTGDLVAMKDLWSPNSGVVCVHPGWPALTTREDIMASWESILSSDRRPKVSFYSPVATNIGDAVIITCYEDVGGAVLTATNMFVPVGGIPRMVFHQASLCGNPPLRPAYPEMDA